MSYLLESFFIGYALSFLFLVFDKAHKHNFERKYHCFPVFLNKFGAGI